MVIFLPKVKSFGEEFGERLGGGISEGYQKAEERKRLQGQIQKENEAAQKLGINISGFTDPKMRQIAMAEALKGQRPLNELQQAQRDLSKAKLEETKSTTKLFNDTLENQDIESNEQINTSSKPKSKMEKLSDAKLNEYAAFSGESGQKGVIGKKAENELKRRKEEKKGKEKESEIQRKQFEADRDYHSKVSRPIVESANERLKISNISRGVREQLRRDISSGNTSGFYPYMVDKLGLESFRNPESARFSNEVKTKFVDSLNDIPGARPNQFIERFLSQAQPMIGRSVEANLSVMDIGDFVEDLKDEQAKLEVEIAKEDRKNFGYVKEDVSERALDRMGDFVNKRQEQMAMDIQKRHEENMEDSDLINEIISGNTIPGSYVTPRTMKIFYLKNNKDMNKAMQEIKKLGMKFPEYLDE